MTVECELLSSVACGPYVAFQILILRRNLLHNDANHINLLIIPLKLYITLQLQRTLSWMHYDFLVNKFPHLVHVNNDIARHCLPELLTKQKLNYNVMLLEQNSKLMLHRDNWADVMLSCVVSHDRVRRRVFGQRARSIRGWRSVPPVWSLRTFPLSPHEETLCGVDRGRAAVGEGSTTTWTCAGWNVTQKNAIYLPLSLP